VNANVALGEDADAIPPPVIEEPTPRAISARTTRMLGSNVPPMLAPGSRRVSSAAPSSRGQATTRYRYVSAPPPPGAPTDARDAAASTASSRLPLEHSGERLVESVRANQNSESFVRQSSVVESGERAAQRSRVLESNGQRALTVVPATRSWRPDLSLLPEARRGLRDELYPLALDGCLVVGVLATEGAECRARLSAEVALALAESGHPRVLVLDADFGRALMQRFLRTDVPAKLSLSEQLAAPAPQHWTVFECTPSLHLLGQAPGARPRSLHGDALVACIAALRPCYDFIVVDGPLLDDAAACEAVREVVDSVVFSHGRYGASEITRVKSLFPEKRISLVPAVG
jgi:Mrp family chromosome partitioning ATPase